MGKRTFALLVTALIAIPMTAFFVFYEIKREDIDVGWGVDALRNPLLAAELYLQKVGSTATSSDQLSPDSELSSVATLYIMDARQVLTRAQSDQVLQWIEEEGGHLILSIDTVTDDNPLLNHFGVVVSAAQECDCEVHSPRDDDKEPSTEEADAALDKEATEGDETEPESFAESLRQYNREIREIQEQGETDAEDDVEPDYWHYPEDLTTLSFDGVEGELTVNLGTDIIIDHASLALDWEAEYLVDEALVDEALEDTPFEQEEYDTTGSDAETVDQWLYEPIYVRGNHLGTQFMQFEAGEGLLTVMAGNSPFTSEGIEQYDHAYLLQILTQKEYSTLLLFGAHRSGLWSLLWKHWPELILSIAALLACLLWSRGKRFGAIYDESHIGSRGIDEHLLSSGEFLWQQKQIELLLAPPRSSLIAAASHRFPNFKSLGAQEQTALLSQSANLQTALAHDALYGPQPTTPEEFTQRVRLLALLKESL